MTNAKTSEIIEAASQQKADILSVREDFFNELLHEWSSPPTEIDSLMGQSEFYLTPDFVSDRKDDPETVMVKNVERGILAVSVTPEGSSYPNGGLRFVYSLMQAGDWLRFGFLVQGDPKLVLQYQRHHDHILSIERIWDRQCDYQFRDSGGMLVEWRFKEPDFYKNYVLRERFKIISRHLHFRLGRSILSIFEDPTPFLEVDKQNSDQTEIYSESLNEIPSSGKVFDPNDFNDDDVLDHIPFGDIDEKDKQRYKQGSEEEVTDFDLFDKDLDDLDDLVS